MEASRPLAVAGTATRWTGNARVGLLPVANVARVTPEVALEAPAVPPAPDVADGVPSRTIFEVAVVDAAAFGSFC